MPTKIILRGGPLDGQTVTNTDKFCQWVYLTDHKTDPVQVYIWTPSLSTKPIYKHIGYKEINTRHDSEPVSDPETPPNRTPTDGLNGGTVDVVPQPPTVRTPTNSGCGVSTLQTKTSTRPRLLPQAPGAVACAFARVRDRIPKG